MDEQHGKHGTESDETGMTTIRTFIQDNLRVITSIFIVAVIAIGIYSYSDRSVPNDGTGSVGETTSSETEKIAGEEDGTEEAAIDDGTEEDRATEREETATHEPSEDEETVSVSDETSRETGTSFVETAERGDGLTHLARKATTHYLEKNADSSLTAEHRVYIEDYLRKHAGHEGRIHVGTSVEFSKDLIGEAVDASKRLDERQLENLKRYSARVSEFG